MAPIHKVAAGSCMIRCLARLFAAFHCCCVLLSVLLYQKRMQQQLAIEAVNERFSLCSRNCISISIGAFSELSTKKELVIFTTCSWCFSLDCPILILLMSSKILACLINIATAYRELKIYRGRLYTTRCQYT